MELLEPSTSNRKIPQRLGSMFCTGYTLGVQALILCLMAANLCLTANGDLVQSIRRVRIAFSKFKRKKKLKHPIKFAGKNLKPLSQGYPRTSIKETKIQRLAKWDMLRLSHTTELTTVFCKNIEAIPKLTTPSPKRGTLRPKVLGGSIDPL